MAISDVLWRAIDELQEYQSRDMIGGFVPDENVQELIEYMEKVLLNRDHTATTAFVGEDGKLYVVSGLPESAEDRVSRYREQKEAMHGK